MRVFVNTFDGVSDCYENVKNIEHRQFVGDNDILLLSFYDNTEEDYFVRDVKTLEVEF